MSHVEEQFFWVPLHDCSLAGCPFPIKPLALSACGSPQTIHFWVLAKSPLSGPGRAPPSCNKSIYSTKKSVRHLKWCVWLIDYVKEFKIPSGWLEEEKGHMTSAPNSEQRGPNNFISTSENSQSLEVEISIELGLAINFRVLIKFFKTLLTNDHRRLSVKLYELL